MDLKERVFNTRIRNKNFDLKYKVLSIGAIGLLLYVVYFLFTKELWISNFFYKIIRAIANLIGIIIG